MTDENTYQGSCFCGTVQLSVTGAPAMMGYCHCEDCRQWSAGPVNAFSLWSPDAVKVTAGEDAIVTYNKTENSYRKWCGKCGGHLFSEHPGMGLTDVYASILPGFSFEPSLHVYYSERTLRITDGLPKWRAMPGADGEAVPE